MQRNNYLFVHFTGEHENGEQIYFSLSRDGLNWNDVNKGNPVLVSGIGEKGVRDPFLVRDEKNNKFYLIATDLRIASGKGWEVAQYAGSRDLIIWESEDLVNFTGPRAVTVGTYDAGCVWAPEAVYDPKKEAFFVFWASMTPKDDKAHAKQKIYAAYTKDFKTFTKPTLYIERQEHVIDTDIVAVNSENSSKTGYIRFSKDETTKNIRSDYGETLDAGNFADIRSEVLDNLHGIEGPICFYINSLKKWCLMVDRYATHKGYLPMLADDIANGNFRILDESEYNLGKTLKRHGGILAISDEEYDRVSKITR